MEPSSFLLAHHPNDPPYLDMKSNGLTFLSDRMHGQEIFAHIILLKGSAATWRAGQRFTLKFHRNGKKVVYTPTRQVVVERGR
jgi:uncharacterized protein involved in type VI secretion and phage assembly